MPPKEPISVRDITNKDGFWITQNIVDGATAANYDVIFTALFPCELIAVAESHRVLGTNGGAVTLDIEKLTSGQALDAGAALLDSTFSLKSTINTPVIKRSDAMSSSRTLNIGDRIALKDAGTLTAVAGVSVTLYFIRRGKGHYE